MTALLNAQTLRESGEIVTTEVRYGGIGIGYLLNGQVYVTTGNGGVVEAENDVNGLVGFARDGGEGYHAKARMIMG